MLPFSSMINRFLLFSLVFCLVLPATALMFSAGPPDGKTGAPGDGLCTDCHAFGPGNGSFQIQGLPANYTLGETYNITVELQDPDQIRWGFELTALDATNSGTGTFSITDSGNTQLSDNADRDYVKHTSAGTYNNTPDGPVSWSFDWMAPATDVGTVSLYAAGNAADGLFTPDNDFIYTASVSAGPSAAATNTPVPTATPDPGNPTPTPGVCSETGVTLEMPGMQFTPGSTVYLKAFVCNASGGELQGYPLFVILNAFGNYFFAPSWKSIDQGIDSYSRDYPVGSTTVDVLPSFTWPAGVGSGTGVQFLGAMTNPGMTELYGTLGDWTFGWSE